MHKQTGIWGAAGWPERALAGWVALAALAACGATAAGGGSGAAPDTGVADNATTDGIVPDAANAAETGQAADAAAAEVLADLAADMAAGSGDAPMADAEVVPVADAEVETKADVAKDSAAADVAKLKTNGALVNPPLDPPSFSKVVDSSGAKVSPDVLQGHWTAMWFYPAASTAG